MEGCNDGTFQGTRQKFFNCPHGTGLYYPLKNLRPDHRWAPQVGNRKFYFFPVTYNYCTSYSFETGA